MKAIIFKILLSAVMLLSATVGWADWTYHKATDKFSGDSISAADLKSENSLSLGYPYSGKNHGGIIVREHPRYGLTIMVFIQRGQIVCRSGSGCGVAVRFDDNPPETFDVQDPDNDDPNVILLADETHFVEMAKKSKRIRILLKLFQEGDQVLEFKSQKQLNWKKPP